MKLKDPERVGQLLIDGNSKWKSSVKSSDRTGIGATEVMIETATSLSQKIMQRYLR